MLTKPAQEQTGDTMRAAWVEQVSYAAWVGMHNFTGERVHLRFTCCKFPMTGGRPRNFVGGLHHALRHRSQN